MSDKLTPITRKETFLAKAGGQNVVTPTPITREETFLQAIIDNGAGGGGGSDLPAVTSEDAGKILTVSNDGEWVAGSGGGGGTGGGALYVTITSQDGETFTASKTFAEIKNAYDTGNAIIFVDGYNYYGCGVGYYSEGEFWCSGMMTNISGGSAYLSTFYVEMNDEYVLYDAGTTN